MKNFVYTIAALACLSAMPALITPASAQVSIGVDEYGPGIRLGRDEDRRMRHGEDRDRYNGFRNQGECRDVTVQTRRDDGTVTTRETRRCN